MGEINLFRIEGQDVRSIEPKSVELERKIQNLIERNLEELLGITFLESEYSTGERHGGRIDTLGIDENYAPVIIEYKKHKNTNVINQGLYYLDWMMDHKAELEQLVEKQIQNDREIEWNTPRLVCIAPDFTKYDSHAVEQIDQNIELMRFKQYQNDILVLELLNVVEASGSQSSGGRDYKGVSHYHDQASDKLEKLFEEFEDYTFSLGDDVQKKELKYYYAYKRIQNFVCLEFKPKDDRLLLHLSLDPESIEDIPEIARDTSDIGTYGTGDLEITIKSEDDLETAKPLIERSYEGGIEA
jgi:predicted transport protein